MIKDNNIPLVTVGIPTYNRVKGLERTLDRMINQTYPNLEIIVSDNCSTDPEVLPVLKKYAALDSRVTYYIQEKNLSIVPNFQFLLDKASGEYFMWAADDDFWDINFIEVCMDGMVQDTDIVACITNVKIIGLNNKEQDAKLTRAFMQTNLYSRLYHWVKSPEEAKYFFCGIYRGSAAKNIKFQNEWGGDHMFLLELITKGKFLYIPGKSNFYYYRGGSSVNVKKVREAFNIKRRFYFFDWYIIRYMYYQFYFKHLNIFQKTGLFFSNSLGLIFNEEGILFRILIKKPFMGVMKRVRKILPFQKKQRITYDQDGLTTVHNTGFMQDPDFSRAEKKGAETGSWTNIHWRVHTILWAADQCKNIEGDFVECGTNKGGFARSIVEYIDLAAAGKSFYLLDTFEGLSEKLMTAEEKKAGKKEHFENVYKSCYEDVVQTFAAFPFVKIIKGAVPGTLANVPSQKIAFLSIDMNSIVPEIAALDYFWDKLSKGGMIVLDDYAFVTCDLQYEADNKWAKEKGIKILSLPTGQGLIVK